MIHSKNKTARPGPYVLFDVGGTNIRLSISQTGRSFIKPVIYPTPKKYSQALKLFKNKTEELIGQQKVNQVIGGITGVFDKNHEKLMRSPHLANWCGQPIKKDLVKLFKARVRLENDTDLVGLGEAKYGAGKKYRIFSYITVSTGIGGTRILDGQVTESIDGLEPGHHIVDATRMKKFKKHTRGYWEQEASGKGLFQRFHVPAEKITDPKIWQEFMDYLAIGLVNVSVFWSPEAIILGGSVMKNPRLKIAKVAKLLNGYLYVFPKSPRLVKARLGDFGGLYGALVLAGQ
ncbi:MAG: ROK family protein [bacterium]